MKVKCGRCNELHDLLGMEPSYAKPDAALRTSTPVKADKNLCIVGKHPEPDARYFVRALIPFKVHAFDQNDRIDGRVTPPPLDRHWGIWTEVSYETFEKVLYLWNDPKQVEHPPLEAKIANSVKGYVRTCWPPADPETLGLKGSICFVNEKEIMHFTFDEDATGPFPAEMRSGMTMKRFAELMLGFLHGEG